MTESKDPPIEPLSYLSSVNVVDIGDLRVARGMSRRPHSSCPHRHLHYDQTERRIWCADCERTIDAFDAFEVMVQQFDESARRLKARFQELREAESFQVRTLAARQLDLAWRHQTMVPICPCCHAGLLPEDFKYGVGGMINRELAEAQRKRRKQT